MKKSSETPEKTLDDKLRSALSAINMIDREILHCESEDTKQCMYKERNNLIIQAVVYAKGWGYKAGFAVYQPITDLMPKPRVSYDNESMARIVYDEPVWEPRFGVSAIIELPTGQVAWCLDSGDLKYDGHTVEEKSQRIKVYLGGVSSEGSVVRL
jgi:hypothetical protein